VCVVSIDFSASFNKISHQYLQEILCAHGFSASFIHSTYNMAVQQCDIGKSDKWFSHQSHPIKSSIRQGCSLSMLVYAMCLNPLIQSLEKDRSGTKFGRRQVRTTVAAYADDVKIFLSSVTDIKKLKETLLAFEAATGVVVSTQKSRALGLGTLDTSRPIVDIPHHKDIRILGFQFTNIVNSTAIAKWSSCHCTGACRCPRHVLQGPKYGQKNSICT